MAREPHDNAHHDPQGDSAVATANEQKTARPRMFKVLLHNDDYTTMDFVVMILMTVFRHPESTAVEIMMSVHQKGVGVAGVYSYEVAETKAAKVTRIARAHEFPLRCSVEP
jgi:ATP-dependent Clp protease adaptor protein ClpS